MHTQHGVELGVQKRLPPFSSLAEIQNIMFSGKNCMFDADTQKFVRFARAHHGRCPACSADVLRALRTQHCSGSHPCFRDQLVTIFLLDFSSVMTDAKAPSAEELAAVSLKKSADERGSGHRAAWESSRGDGAKVAETIGLNGVPASYDEYIAMVKGGKFTD